MSYTIQCDTAEELRSLLANAPVNLTAVIAKPAPAPATQFNPFESFPIAEALEIATTNVAKGNWEASGDRTPGGWPLYVDGEGWPTLLTVPTVPEMIDALSGGQTSQVVSDWFAEIGLITPAPAEPVTPARVEATPQSLADIAKAALVVDTARMTALLAGLTKPGDSAVWASGSGVQNLNGLTARAKRLLRTLQLDREFRVKMSNGDVIVYRPAPSVDPTPAPAPAPAPMPVTQFVDVDRPEPVVIIRERPDGVAWWPTDELSDDEASLLAQVIDRSRSEDAVGGGMYIAKLRGRIQRDYELFDATMATLIARGLIVSKRVAGEGRSSRQVLVPTRQGLVEFGDRAERYRSGSGFDWRLKDASL
jgi:hypothetical protein